MSGDEDVEAFERRLAEVDFSADSRVRADLRARLLRRRSPRRLTAPFVFALALASALLAVLVPALRRALRPASEAAFVYPRGEEGLPVLPGRFSPGASVSAPVFEVARGREILLEDGKAVVWDFEDASFRLETRRIAPEDLFEKPHLRGVL